MTLAKIRTGISLIKMRKEIKERRKRMELTRLIDEANPPASEDPDA